MLCFFLSILLCVFCDLTFQISNYAFQNATTLQISAAILDPVFTKLSLRVLWVTKRGSATMFSAFPSKFVRQSRHTNDNLVMAIYYPPPPYIFCTLLFSIESIYSWINYCSHSWSQFLHCCVLCKQTLFDMSNKELAISFFARFLIDIKRAQRVLPSRSYRKSICSNRPLVFQHVCWIERNDFKAVNLNYWAV